MSTLLFYPRAERLETLLRLAKQQSILRKTPRHLVTGTQAALACKAETQTNQTSFVFASVGEPAISGLSPQPGGNFTGCSNQQVSLCRSEWMEMLAHQFQGPFAVVGNYNIEPIKSAMMSAVSVLIAKGMQAQLAPITPQEQHRYVISAVSNAKASSLFMFAATRSLPPVQPS